MLIDGISYSPWFMGTHRVAATLAGRCSMGSALVYDVLDPETLPFYQLVNAANNLAFGGLGMPAWVQLDCCTLPSAMVGFATSRETLAPSLYTSLLRKVSDLFGSDAARALRAYNGPVPVSEYCGLKSLEEDTLVGVSLFSLHRGIGVRTKALALKSYGCERQMGITQYDNPSVRTHCALGPLRVVSPRAAAHTWPERSFVYMLEVSPDRLDALLERGGAASAPAQSATHLLELDAERTSEAVYKLMQTSAEVFVCPPGHVETAEGVRLALRVSSG